jgi:superfamily II DNA/RNA helicase
MDRGVGHEPVLARVCDGRKRAPRKCRGSVGGGVHGVQHLTRQNALRLQDLAVVVLDEADRLLDAGFADETRRVLALLPRPRQTLMFSATLPDAVLALAKACQTDALRVEASEPWAGPT